MEPKIVLLKQKKLIGNSVLLSLANNKTRELWQNFMPRRKEIISSISSDLICMQLYDKNIDFATFNINTVWEKWAAVEVSDFTNVPEGLKTYTIEGGLFAVFNYKGTPEQFHDTFYYILNVWLPQSKYKLDNREHFEILGNKYIPNNPDSEEEIWVPIK